MGRDTSIELSDFKLRRAYISTLTFFVRKEFNNSPLTKLSSFAARAALAFLSSSPIMVTLVPSMRAWAPRNLHLKPYLKSVVESCYQ